MVVSEPAVAKADAELEADRVSLRKELEFLKGCQVRYFVLSVTTTGAVVGLASRLAATPPDAVLYLAPLLVTLPCWWIFFDKGTTISRIVAYVRVLEDLRRAGATERSLYIGWENALDRFRANHTTQPIMRRVARWLRDWAYGVCAGIRALLLLTTHKYWALNYWTFFGLSGASLWLARGARTSPDGSLWVTFCVLSGFSAFYNIGVLGRLTFGSYSYRRNYDQWNNVLRQVAPRLRGNEHQNS